MTEAPARTLPFVDLSHANAAIERDVLADTAALLASGEFSNGPHVKRFEHAFAAYCGARALRRRRRAASTRSGSHCIAAGIEPGDEVIVPAQHLRRHVRGGRARRVPRRSWST